MGNHPEPYQVIQYYAKAAEMKDYFPKDFEVENAEATVPVAPLNHALNRLSKDIIECHNLLTSLSTLLEPVIRFNANEPSETDVTTKASPEGNSWLDTQLASLNLDIVDLQARLQTLIDRVYL